MIQQNCRNIHYYPDCPIKPNKLKILWVLILLGMYNFDLTNVGMDSTTSDFRFARARGGGLEAANHQTNWIAQQRDLGK